MPKLFSKILTRKKLILFAVLFFIFIGSLAVSTPVTAQALAAGVNPAGGMANPAAAATPQPTAKQESSWWDTFNPVKFFASDLPQSLANGFIYVLALVPLVLTTLLADISGIMFRFFLTLAVGGISYTDNSAVQIGWPMVRDLANMIIVLGFVIIGIATALRVKEYEAKQLLWKLIVVALFVNFSLMICEVVIDISNILVKHFAGAADFNNLSKLFQFKGLSSVADLGLQITKDNTVAFLVKAFSVVFFNIILMAVFSLYFFLFSFRIVAIWILVVFSPLAFVLSVFPATRKFYETWKNNFVQWCFIGVPAAFFLYLAQAMHGELTAKKYTVSFTSMEAFSKSLTDFASILMPCIFLIAGFLATIKLSSALAGSGLVKWAGGKSKSFGKGALRAVGASTQNISGKVGDKMKGLGSGSSNKFIRGAGKFADKTIGGGFRQIGNAKASFDKRRSALGRGLEAIGAIAPNTTGMAAVKSVDEEVKGIKFVYKNAKVSNDRKTINRIRNDAVTASGTKGAASYKVISDDRDLADTFKDAAGNPNFDAMYTRGIFAEANGAQGVVDENQKLNPFFRAKSEYLRSEKATKLGVPNDAAHKIQINKEVIADGFRRAGQKEIENYHYSVLETPEFGEHVSFKALGRAASRMSAENREKTATGIRKQVLSMLGYAAGATPSVSQIRTEIATLKASAVAADKEMGRKIEKLANRYMLVK